MGITEILLNRLKNQNPTGYQFVMKAKQSGKNPTEILREMYQKGQINDFQLNNIQKQARMFGISISNNELEKIKSIDIKSTSTNKKFGGWF